MDDYISREAALEIVRKAYFDESPCPFEMTVRDILREMVYISPASVRPVVWGEWLEGPGMWTCSACGYTVQGWNNTNFCPNCGADMRGGTENV